MQDVSRQKSVRLFALFIVLTALFFFAQCRERSNTAELKSHLKDTRFKRYLVKPVLYAFHKSCSSDDLRGLRSTARLAMDEWTEKVSVEGFGFKESSQTPVYSLDLLIRCREGFYLDSYTKTEVVGPTILTLGYKRDGRTNVPTIDRDVALHELGHFLGLMHEHQRPDRDNFIVVEPENMAPRYRFTLQKIEGGSSPSSSYFDYKSIMLYDSTVGSINGKPVIKHIDGSLISRNTTVTAQDADGVRRMLRVTPNDALNYYLYEFNSIHEGCSLSNPENLNAQATWKEDGLEIKGDSFYYTAGKQNLGAALSVKLLNLNTGTAYEDKRITLAINPSLTISANHLYFRTDFIQSIFEIFSDSMIACKPKRGHYGEFSNNLKTLLPQFVSANNIGWFKWYKSFAIAMVKTAGGSKKTQNTNSSLTKPIFLRVEPLCFMTEDMKTLHEKISVEVRAAPEVVVSQMSKEETRKLCEGAIANGYPQISSTMD